MEIWKYRILESVVAVVVGDCDCTYRSGLACNVFLAFPLRNFLLCVLEISFRTPPFLLKQAQASCIITHTVLWLFRRLPAPR